MEILISNSQKELLEEAKSSDIKIKFDHILQRFHIILIIIK